MLPFDLRADYILIVGRKSHCSTLSDSLNYRPIHKRQKQKKNNRRHFVPLMENGNAVSSDKPTVMVTNDDGIDAPGLRALVRALVSTNLFHVIVFAPDSYCSSLLLNPCIFSDFNLSISLSAIRTVNGFCVVALVVVIYG